jgi:hypothetical protein
MDEDIIRLATTAQGALEIRLVEQSLTQADLALLSGFEFVSLAGCSLAEKPGVNNWVEEQGGLPEYICEVARAVKRKGMTTSRAIAIAVGQIKNWAHGKGDVNADTRAKAAAALTRWTAMKAAAKAH